MNLSYPGLACDSYEKRREPQNFNLNCPSPVRQLAVNMSRLHVVKKPLGMPALGHPLGSTSGFKGGKQPEKQRNNE